MDKIIKAACEAAGVSEEQLLGLTRTRYIIYARHIARWQMVREGATYQQAADATGATNHATAYSSVNTIDRLIAGRDKIVTRLMVKFLDVYEAARCGGAIMARAKGKTLVFTNDFTIATYHEGVLTINSLLGDRTKTIENNNLTCEQVVKLMQ